jgi:hypothetical protein
MTRSAESEKLSLDKAAETLLDECRMVLPGIQALFGFQLIAVFSDGFDKKLSPFEQQLHVAAIALIALAIAIIMTPAAYHRHKGALEVTLRFIAVSTRLLLWAMTPLAVGICLEFYLVAHAVVPSPAIAWISGALFAIYLLLWFVLPRVKWLRELIATDSP